MRLLKGSCLCANIQYTVEESAIYFVNNCHCRNCRKASGAAYGTMAQVRADGFRWVEGEHSISLYPSSPGVNRAFCRTCGSRVPQISADGSTVSIPAAGLDDPLGRTPQVNMWVQEKADWHQLEDNIPACDDRGSPEFWAELLGGSAETYRALQEEIDRQKHEPST